MPETNYLHSHTPPGVSLPMKTKDEQKHPPFASPPQSAIYPSLLCLFKDFIRVHFQKLFKKKHNPKAFIWANVYTDTMFLRAFCVFWRNYVITGAHDSIHTSTKGCGVQLQHSQHNSNKSLREVCNLAWSHFFLGEAKLPLCWGSPADTPPYYCM